MNISIPDFIPESISISRSLIFFAGFVFVILVISWLLRKLFGKDSDLRHAFVSALAIILLYALCIVIYTFNPAGLRRFLAPLPFVTFADDRLTLFSFRGADFSLTSLQLISMLLLTYLVNQISNLAPDKLKLFNWIMCRLGLLVLSIFAYYLAYCVLGNLAVKLLPGPVLEYTSVILLGIVGFMFLLGILKFLLGLFLAVANPLLGGIYAFFFANKLGKNISRAIGSTTALTILVLLVQRLGFCSLSVGPSELIGYIPFCICILVLWVFAGRNT